MKENIADVDNKESFGDDGISYGFLKKMSRWISQEMTDIMNMSLEIKIYPTRWKIARVKPLFKGEGCDRPIQSHSGQLPSCLQSLGSWRQ